MNQAKEYLSQIRTLDIMIRQRQNEANILKDAAMSSGSLNMDPNRSKTESPDPDPLADKIAQYVDIQNEIDGMIADLIILRHTIIQQIQRLGNPSYIEVLYKRYVELKQFEMIAEEMHYTVRHITRLHGMALKMFNELFEFKDVL